MQKKTFLQRGIYGVPFIILVAALLLSSCSVHPSDTNSHNSSAVNSSTLTSTQTLKLHLPVQLSHHILSP